MRLADARALVAGLVTAGAEPERDRRGLERLALWCNRFTPLCAVDSNAGDGDGGDGGDDHGLLLDIAGCAHLFGGEAALVKEIAARLAGLGVEARLGLADTPGAAWALARFGHGRTRCIATPGARPVRRSRTLPVEALAGSQPTTPACCAAWGSSRSARWTACRARLWPAASPAGERSGAVLARLDRALGRCAEPLVPVAPPPACLERLALPEPLIDRDGAGRGAGPAHGRAERGAGARRARRPPCLALVVLPGRRRRGAPCCRPRRARHGTAIICCASSRETLGTVDPGFGIDHAALHAERMSSPSRPRSFPSPAAGGGRAA